MIRKRPGQLVRGRKGTVLGGKSAEKYNVPINFNGPAPRASLEHYWHPNRAGVEPAPEHFAQKLTALHADLACCRPPASAPLAEGKAPAWLLWYRRPRVTHALCPGWLLLFSWRDDANVPQQLDERVFAVLQAGSAFRWGSGENYFKRAIEEKMRDAKLARKRATNDHLAAKRRDFVQSTRISTAGSGSKFARHHDGTLAPGRGQLNWHVENRRRLMPSELIKAEDEAKERARALAADLAKLR